MFWMVAAGPKAEIFALTIEAQVVCREHSKGLGKGGA
jgi:hypothetical protein